jgi:hypothetical protein
MFDYTAFLPSLPRPPAKTRQYTRPKASPTSNMSLQATLDNTIKAVSNRAVEGQRLLAYCLAPRQLPTPILGPSDGMPQKDRALQVECRLLRRF